MQRKGKKKNFARNITFSLKEKTAVAWLQPFKLGVRSFDVKLTRQTGEYALSETYVHIF